MGPNDHNCHSTQDASLHDCRLPTVNSHLLTGQPQPQPVQQSQSTLLAYERLLPFTGHTRLRAYEADDSIAAAQRYIIGTIHTLCPDTVAHPLSGEALMTCKIPDIHVAFAGQCPARTR